MNTDDIRWKQRYAHFSRALTLLREVVDESDIEKLKPLEQEGTIQRFEFTFELAWKTLKDYMIHRGIHFTEITPRVVIKEAFAAGILYDGQVFIDMLLSRNQLSHTYDFEKFRQVIREIKERYKNALEQLNDFFIARMFDE